MMVIVTDSEYPGDMCWHLVKCVCSDGLCEGEEVNLNIVHGAD